MTSHVDLGGAGNQALPRGASGREIALRFNRALMMVSALLIAAVWLLPA